MAYLEEAYPEPTREKMRKWGVLKDEPMPFHEPIDIILSLLSSGRLFRVEPVDITAEIGELKRRVRELEARVGERRKPTMADYVYELFKEELEEKHFGKIVAIDAESEKIVGIGDTILEAYNMAVKETGKDQFDFRRVGYKYIYKV